MLVQLCVGLVQLDFQCFFFPFHPFPECLLHCRYEAHKRVPSIMVMPLPTRTLNLPLLATAHAYVWQSCCSLLHFSHLRDVISLAGYLRSFPGSSGVLDDASVGSTLQEPAGREAAAAPAN